MWAHQYTNPFTSHVRRKIETDHWEHVAFTWNRNAATLFINGVLIKKSFPQIVADLVSSSHHVYDIGFKRDSSHYAGGFFRDLHLYKRALTAEEVEDLFQGIIGLPASRNSLHYATR